MCIYLQGKDRGAEPIQTNLRGREPPPAAGASAPPAAASGGGGAADSEFDLF